MYIYVSYVDIAFLDRMLTAASSFVTLDYFQKNIVDFTLPILVFTNTLSNILQVRQNVTTKAQV